MDCPYCRTKTRVTETRQEPGALVPSVTRQRTCTGCGKSFATVEQAKVSATELSKVVKRDGRLEAFDVERIRTGIQAALAKSTDPVPQTVVDDIVTNVIRLAQDQRPDEGTSGPRTVTTHQVGTIVLEQLKQSRAILAASRIRFAIGFLRFRRVRELGDWLQDPANWPATEHLPLSNPRPGEVAVRKRTGSDDTPWDQAKLAHSIEIAARSVHLHKTSVTWFANDVAEEVRRSLGRQSIVLSEQISSEVMRVLRARGAHVPYLRYATTVKRMRTMQEFWIEYQDVLQDDREEWVL